MFYFVSCVRLSHSFQKRSHVASWNLLAYTHPVDPVCPVTGGAHIEHYEIASIINLRCLTPKLLNFIELN